VKPSAPRVGTEWPQARMVGWLGAKVNRRFFSGRGYAVLQSELLWIWVPALLFATAVWLMGHTRRTGVAANQ